MTVDLSAVLATSADRTRAWRRALPAIFRRSQPANGSAKFDARLHRLRTLGEACTVLESARALVGRGWVQDNWYALRHVDSPASRTFPSNTTALAGTAVRGACLVAAVVHAAGADHPAAGLVAAGPALDLVWDAWQESRGFAGPGVAGRAASREVRAARVRDLTRWNDQPGRTQDDVRGLLDVAISRAVMEAANTPLR